MEGGLLGKIKISNIENSEELFDYLCDVSDSFARMLDENDLEYDQIEDSAELYMSDDAFFCVSLNKFVDYIKDTVSEFPSLTLESEVTTYDTCADRDFKILYSDRKIKILWADDYYFSLILVNYEDYVSLCADYNDTNVLSEEEWNVQNEESNEWYVIGDSKVSHKLDFKFHTSRVIKIKPKEDRLKDLAERDFVEDKLNLSELGVTELTEGLTIDGDLKLRNASITKLPQNLTVKGDLDLISSKITKLPEGLTVGGSLDLSGTKITELPEGLTVGGSLNLWDSNITELPEDLTVDGNLNLCSTKIAELLEGLTVNGELDLSSSKITELPESLSVGGDLVLSYTEITKLPEGLTVGGKIKRF